MKTASWIAVVGLVALAVAQTNGQTMSGNRAGSTFSAGRRPEVRHHEHHRPVVCVNSLPLYYPVYYPPYLYSVTYDSGYDDAKNSKSNYDQGWYVSSSTSPQQDTERTYQAGRDWGQDLRRDVATWDQFVDYVRAYIVNASVAVRNDFRRGFAVGYGTNADAAFDKGLNQASQQSTVAPKILTFPPKTSSPGY